MVVSGWKKKIESVKVTPVRCPGKKLRFFKGCLLEAGLEPSQMDVSVTLLLHDV